MIKENDNRFKITKHLAKIKNDMDKISDKYSSVEETFTMNDDKTILYRCLNNYEDRRDKISPDGELLRSFTITHNKNTGKDESEIIDYNEDGSSKGVRNYDYKASRPVNEEPKDIENFTEVNGVYKTERLTKLDNGNTRMITTEKRTENGYRLNIGTIYPNKDKPDTFTKTIRYKGYLIEIEQNQNENTQIKTLKLKQKLQQRLKKL